MGQGFMLDIGRDMPFNPLGADQFLREVVDLKSRASMVAQHGGDAAKIAQFEESRGLPAGAFEVVLMLDDPFVKSTNKRVMQGIEGCKGDVERLKAFQDEMAEVTEQLRNRYPRATTFMEDYHKAVMAATGSDGAVAQEAVCQFVIPLVAIAVGVLVFTVAAATVAVAANAAAAANAISVVNVIAVVDG